MPSLRITDLPSITAVAPTDVLPVVNNCFFGGGNCCTAQITTSNFAQSIASTIANTYNCFSPYTANNTLSSIQPFLGCSNTKTAGQFSNIGGGFCNNANGLYSSVGGGSLNVAGSAWAFVGGGSVNQALSGYSTIAGGWANCANNWATAIGGGYGNAARGSGSTIGGGLNNTTSGIYSVVGGGRSLSAFGNYSAIVGGYCNTISSGYSFIAGGSGNNTKGFTNTFLLGTNLSATQNNTTYTNNILALGTSLPGGSTTFNSSILTISSFAVGSVYASIYNSNQGLSASADLSIYNDQGNYVDIGISNSKYNGNLYSPIFNVVSAGDAYAYSTAGDFGVGTIGTGANTGDLILFTGGSLSGSPVVGGSEALRITSTSGPLSGKVGVHTPIPSSTLHVSGSFASYPPIISGDTSTLTGANGILTGPLSAYWTSFIWTGGNNATIVLPDPVRVPGRWLHIRVDNSITLSNISSNIRTLSSFSTFTNTIVPQTSASTIGGTRGKWVQLQSDGAFWSVMAAN